MNKSLHEKTLFEVFQALVENLQMFVNLLYSKIFPSIELYSPLIPYHQFELLPLINKHIIFQTKEKPDELTCPLICILIINLESFLTARKVTCKGIVFDAYS